MWSVQFIHGLVAPELQSAIEAEKFQNMVSSIGADTLQAISTAGPEMQVRVHNQCYPRYLGCSGGERDSVVIASPPLPSP